MIKVNNKKESYNNIEEMTLKIKGLNTVSTEQYIHCCHFEEKTKIEFVKLK